MIHLKQLSFLVFFDPVRRNARLALQISNRRTYSPARIEEVVACQKQQNKLMTKLSKLVNEVIDLGIFTVYTLNLSVK
jgi:hypothetical protein